MKKDLINIFKDNIQTMIVPMVLWAGLVFYLSRNPFGTADDRDFNLISSIVVTVLIVLLQMFINFKDYKENNYAFKSILIYSLIEVVVFVFLSFIAVTFFL